MIAQFTPNRRLSSPPPKYCRHQHIVDSHTSYLVSSSQHNQCTQIAPRSSKHKFVNDTHFTFEDHDNLPYTIWNDLSHCIWQRANSLFSITYVHCQSTNTPFGTLVIMSMPTTWHIKCFPTTLAFPVDDTIYHNQSYHGHSSLSSRQCIFQFLTDPCTRPPLDH